MFGSFAKNLFGSSNDRAVKALQPLVQPINAATATSVGVKPSFVPPRSTGSSIVISTSRTLQFARECEGQSPFTDPVMVVLSLIAML